MDLATQAFMPAVIAAAPLTLAAAFLLVACYYYNKLVTLVNGKDDQLHYIAFEVIAGVAGVLVVAIPIVGLEVVLRLFVLFAAAGIPMTVGYIQRHYSQATHDRDMMHQHVEDELGHDD